MSRHRTTARGAVLTLIAALAATSAATASAGVPRLIFPVVGPASYTNDFGDPRGQSAHEGNDIVAPRRALAVAVEAGRVDFHTTSSRAGCMLYLHGASGTSYRYIHLNNDLTSANDNRGRCVAGVAYAKDLRPGARVVAGQPVGYVGDSGDANGGSTHLHFEVHPGDGAAVSPFRYLRAARKLLFAAAPGTTVGLTLRGRLVESYGDAITLRVEQLDARALGLRIANVGRTIDLNVAPEVEVVTALGSLLAAATLESVKAGERALVSTAPERATLAAQLGEPLALTAERVVLGR